MAAKNISKKQAGVIYGNWKRGNLVATKETMNLVYSFAEYFVTTDSVTENLVTILRHCIDSIFKNDLDSAQHELDLFVTIYNRSYSAV